MRTPITWLVPSLLLCCGLLVHCNVIIELDTKWKQTPIVLEASEYLAEESNDIFWKFVNSAVSYDFSDLVIDRENYDLTVRLAKDLLSPMKLNLLKFSLSLRSYSPKVILHNQLSSSEVSKCDTFVKINGVITCNYDDIEALLNTPPSGSVDRDWMPSEHIVQSDSSTVAILFGRIGYPEFNKMHLLLYAKALKGDCVYVIRHHYRNSADDKNIVLSGYGVELAIKSTEYKAKDDAKVDATGDLASDIKSNDDLYGFKFSTLRNLYPDLAGNISEFKQYLIESHGELADMKVWQLQDLSLQAAQIILNSPRSSSLEMLQHISQNFPIQARLIFNSILKKEFTEELAHNQEIFQSQLMLERGESVLLINGMSINLDMKDIFSLLDLLKSESNFMHDLFTLGIKGNNLDDLKHIQLAGTETSFAVDYRHKSIIWINDLSRDKQYYNWPSSIKYLLRPSYPGMLTHLRKNIFNMIFMIDPLDKESHGLVKSAEAFYHHNAPVRIGISLLVPDLDDAPEKDVRLAIFRCFTYIKKKVSRQKALRFLTDLFDDNQEEDVISYDAVVSQFVDSFSDSVDYTTVLEPTKYSKIIKESAGLHKKLGFTSLPQVLVNGIPLDQSNLNTNKFEEAVITKLSSITKNLQDAVNAGELTDHNDLDDFICTRKNVVSKLNSRILSPTKKYVIFSMSKAKSDAALSDLTATEISSLTLKSARYISSPDADDEELFSTSLWVATDISTASGRQYIYSAIQHMKSTPSMRMSLIQNGAGSSKDSTDRLMMTAVLVAMETLPQQQARAYVEMLLSPETHNDLVSGQSSILGLVTEDMDEDDFKKSIESFNLADLIARHSKFCTSVLKLAANQTSFVMNGMIVGPLDAGEAFESQDVKLLQGYIDSQSATEITSMVTQFETVNRHTDMVIMISSILMTAGKSSKRQFLSGTLDLHSMLQYDAINPDMPSYDIVAVLDPVSRHTQTYIPLIITLMKVLNANVKIYMNCNEKLSSMPVKNFYQYLIEAEPTFQPKTGDLISPKVTFTNLPTKALLTLGMNAPESWLIESVRTPYDLDNIQLSEVNGDVSAIYELEYLLLEGHCHDDKTGQPSRGLQFVLKNNVSHIPVVDTIVMANLGYLQLKASPGVWNLELRSGKSNDIYYIASYELGDRKEFFSENSKQRVVVYIDSFKTNVVKVKVNRKRGKERANLLEDDDDEDSASGAGGIWQSISSTLGGSSHVTTNKTLNIFSLASGHLYERFLRIMMLSVLKNTKQKVKFWFLKNYLSSSFKEFIPLYSKKYNFDYELVQYKWPRWLHKQTEKQRIIWGYKILFLDVLFPLNVDKIIYVDADQIVRADLQELIDLDLEGAAYGYTPFCSSRKEMDGFRFWNSGYWRNHLNGRKYHISALYVVDLKQFKRIAAGDRLRGQYQGLSQDPNSLSNLDQDLPNNMIHQVPMKSLPQEWLWCETWCSNEELKKAKTIDLCNNPLTKEPKLNAAARIVPEWTDYDKEIKVLFDDAQATRTASAAAAAAASKSNKQEL